MARAALRLTSGNVLYFYRDLQTNFLRAIAPRKYSELRKLRWKAFSISDGRLHVISLSGLNAFLPLALSSMTSKSRSWIFRRNLVSAMRQADIDITAAIAIVYWWHFPVLWRQLGMKKVIFDIIDNHAALGMNMGRTRHNRFTNKLVSETASQADAVTILSPALVGVLPKDCSATLMPGASIVTILD